MLFSHFIEGDTQPFVSSPTTVHQSSQSEWMYSACVMVVRSGFLLRQHTVFLLDWFAVLSVTPEDYGQKVHLPLHTSLTIH